MVALHDVFVVLENNLDEGPVVGPQHRRIGVYTCAPGGLGDAPYAEDSVDLEVVSELHGRVRGNEGDAVEGVPLLAIHLAGRAGQPDGFDCVDHAVVV